MSDQAANDPAEMNKALRDITRAYIARVLANDVLQPYPLVAWLTRPPPPGIYWHRLNNRTHRVEIRREG